MGGKMVSFAGFEMPVQYPTGITREHHAVREACGLFDVSHMGEYIVRGPQALDLIERITINDASGIAVGQAQYSAMCTESGGMLDDLLVYRFDDSYMLVVNASNLAKDLRWISEHAAGLDVEVLDRSEETSLLAIQGPRAREILGALTDHELDGIRYYRHARGSVAGVEAVISATGYTGEDGFELYVESVAAVGLWRSLLEAGEALGLVPAGLGARDSLRLEAGYALYGNDLDEEHSPLEAGLGWITKLEKGDFIGREALVRQKEIGVPQRLRGLVLKERGFPRPGYQVVSGDRTVGTITSGVLSPTLGVGIAMAYLPVAVAAPGNEVGVSIRGMTIRAEVVRPRFYTTGSIKR